MRRRQADIPVDMRVHRQADCALGFAPHKFEFENLSQDPNSSVVCDQVLDMGQEVVAFNKCHDMFPERAEATLNVVK